MRDSDLRAVYLAEQGPHYPGAQGTLTVCFTLQSLAEWPPSPGNPGSPSWLPGREQNFFKGPFHEGKKILQKPYTGIDLTIQGPLTNFYTGLQQGKGGGGKQRQKREERNSLNLILDVNKKIVQVDGGRKG